MTSISAVKSKKDFRTTLAAAFGVKNALAAPTILKVTLNVGLNARVNDAKLPEVIQSVLTRISGQRPVARLAKKSISNFKVREGMVVGYIVTLRGKRMQDFVAKLITLVLPRVRDFRGLPEKTVDARGNLSIGFREYLAFPEIRSDEVEKLHGLEVNITTSAGSRERGITMLRALGFPLAK